jgi:hypothetical protein
LAFSPMEDQSTSLVSSAFGSTLMKQTSIDNCVSTVCVCVCVCVYFFLRLYIDDSSGKCHIYLQLSPWGDI